MMRRIVSIFIITVILISSCVACGTKKDDTSGVNHEPNLGQMRNICELATMECYYHNVAKYEEENATGFWLWKKDKRFWIRYDGTVTMGIDASKVSVKVNKNDEVIITIPQAKVLDSKVNPDSLTKDSFYFDKDSADITDEDQTKAYKAAEKQMEDNASNDTVLLSEAQQRAQSMLEDYVNNLGKTFGKQYTINWKYIEDEEE